MASKASRTFPDSGSETRTDWWPGVCPGLDITQTPGTTGQFDRYLRAVEDRDAKKKQPTVAVDPKIAEYLDSLEQEFAPLRPNMIPSTESAGSTGR